MSESPRTNDAAPCALSCSFLKQQRSPKLHLKWNEDKSSALERNWPDRETSPEVFDTYKNWARLSPPHCPTFLPPASAAFPPRCSALARPGLLMSRPLLAMLLLFVPTTIGMADPGVAVTDSNRRGHHHPPLLHCGPAPVLSKAAEELATLPSAAAYAEERAFAAVQIGNAFARGTCFGANVSFSQATTRVCEACLSAAARDVTGGCRASGRAGAWRNECFLSYADSNAPSSTEDAFSGWFYTGPRTEATLAAGACVTDRAVVDCDRCWHESARAAAALGWWQRIHARR